MRADVIDKVMMTKGRESFEIIFGENVSNRGIMTISILFHSSIKMIKMIIKKKLTRFYLYDMCVLVVS